MSPRVNHETFKPDDPDTWPDVMMPGHVALVFGADPKTVTRWADSGRLPHFRTLGGRRRFLKADIVRMRWM